MVNYESTKIISFGVPGHKPNDANTFLIATVKSTAAQALAEIRRVYKNFLAGKGKEKPYFKLIQSIGIDNLRASVVAVKSCANKKEVNAFLKDTITELNQSVESAIDKNKKELKSISVDRYKATLATLQKRLDDSSPLFYKKTKDVLHHILNSGLYALETQKNYLKALIAFVPDGNEKELYRSTLMDLGAKAQAIRDTNVKSSAQIENWVDYDSILKEFRKLKEEGVSKQLVIACFYAGVFFAPWRIQECIELKINNYNAETDNYLDLKNKIIVLNKYKTFKDYGRYTQLIPKPLVAILTAYCRNLKGDYLITDDNGNQLTYYMLTKYLDSIFGCSVNILRSSYITHLFSIDHFKTINDYKRTAHEMRHSPTQLLEYKKV